MIQKPKIIDMGATSAHVFVAGSYTFTESK